MPVPQRNATAAPAATTTSDRYYPRPGHTQLTLTYSNMGSVSLTFRAYAIDEATGRRVYLDREDTVTTGNSASATFVGTFSAIEVDVVNAAPATAGSFSWSVQVGED